MQPSVDGCPLEIGQRVSAVLADGTDVHTWLLELGTAGDLFVALTDLLVDYDVHVYGTDGELVEESLNEGPEDEVVLVSDLDAGEYRIYVNSGRGDTVAVPYTLLAIGTVAPDEEEASQPVGQPESQEPAPATALPTPLPTVEATSTPQAQTTGGAAVDVNGSFERGRRLPENWIFEDPYGVIEPEDLYEWSSTVARTGTRSVAVGHPVDRATWKFQLPGPDRYLTVPQDALFAEVKLWCRTDDPDALAAARARGSVQGARSVLSPGGVRVRFLRASPGLLSDFAGTWQLRCGREWTENTFRAPIANDVNNMTVWLGLDGPVQATVWFDDLALSFR